MKELSSMEPSAHQPALFLIQIGMLSKFSNILDRITIMKLPLDNELSSILDKTKFAVPDCSF